MAALRRSLPPRAILRRLLPSGAPSSAAADSSFRRSFWSSNGQGEGEGERARESADAFMNKMFGEKRSNESPLHDKLDGHWTSGRRHNMDSGMGGLNYSDRSDHKSFDGTLNDGLDRRLDTAALTRSLDENVDGNYYPLRPDTTFKRGSTYQPQGFDPTRPRRPRRPLFQTTTEEVLRKADFRNIRFLGNFLTESGIIMKRSQTKISAKAQRKVAREIKTARALGLMPFTTMGKKPFNYSKISNVDVDEEEEYAYRFAEQRNFFAEQRSFVREDDKPDVTV